MKLIVTPIDLSAPGSYRLRKRYLALMRDMRNITQGDAVAVMEQTDELVRDRLRTDDDSPIEEALDQISAEEFDKLIWAIGFEGGNSIPPVNASSSTNGRKGKRSTRRNG